MSNKIATLIKNAEHVSIEQPGRNKGDIILTVNDKSVNLTRRHPIAIASSLTTPEDAAASLQNGHFVIEDFGGHLTLKEYRDSTYKGFIQDEAFIERFGNDASLDGRGLESFELPEFGLGGKFNLTTGFTWSAFSRNLKTQVNVMRLICLNGMVARNPLFEREVPIINMYDHHLDIAARQLIDISRDHISERIHTMGREHAYVREVDLIKTHIDKRLKADPQNERLATLLSAIEINGDVHDFYTQRAINDGGIIASLPSPISRLDLWNITTELNSHSEELVESTSMSLDRIASSLLFPKGAIEGVIATVPEKTTFGDPERAFFGS